MLLPRKQALVGVAGNTGDGVGGAIGGSRVAAVAVEVAEEG